MGIKRLPAPHAREEDAQGSKALEETAAIPRQAPERS